MISTALVGLLLLFGVVTAQVTIDNIRLAEGRNSAEGRVELRYQGSWGILCDHDLDVEVAKMVCRLTGNTYDYAVPMGTSYFGSGSPSFRTSNVTCKGGGLTLSDCEMTTLNQGVFCENAGVICRETNETVVRLAVGLQSRVSLDHGRVEVFHGNEWGTICDDSWSTNDARVICNMLNITSFFSPRALSRASYGRGSGSIMLDDVICSGNESNIDDCRHRLWYDDNCGHSEDAGVNCNGGSGTGGFTTVPTVTSVQVRLSGGPAPNQGIVNILVNGQWGTICDDGFYNEEAAVICGMLGYNGENATTLNQFLFNQSPRSYPILLDDVRCSGYETNIMQCRHRAWGSNDCTHSEDVAVHCPSENDTFIDPSAVNNLEVRLVGGNTSHEGRVEVNIAGEWGTVCDDYWSYNDAAVVCRMLGYTTRNAQPRTRGVYGQGTGRILLDDVRCSGYESNLGRCRHNTVGYNNCDHGDDAGVNCSPNVTDVRLVGGNTSYEGTVEVLIDGEWGTVCDDGWNIGAARVVCKMLGYSAVRYERSAAYGRGSGRILLDNVYCSGSEGNLGMCRHNPVGTHNCDHGDDAGVLCSPRVGQVRLVNGSSPLEGRVEINVGGEWGTVCDDSWTNENARVVCRMLGFPTYNSLGYSFARYGQGDGRILLDNVECRGYEDSISDCRHSAIGIHNCLHSEDAGVSCFASGLQCYHCDGVADSSRCRSTVTCPAGEACYQAAYSINGQVLHTMGCRSQLECDGTAPSVGKRAVGLQSQCCHSNRCNHNLFGLTTQRYATTLSPDCVDNVPAGMTCGNLMSSMNLCSNTPLAMAYCRRSCRLC